MWSSMKPAMIGMDSANNIWEKFANLLDPKPPFHTSPQKPYLASILLGVVGISLIITRSTFVRSATLFGGIALFGAPIIKSSQAWLDVNYPAWSIYLSLER